MPVYSVGTPGNTHSATGSVTGTWGSTQFRQAGHLLVAVVSCAATTSVTATATVSGWTLQLEVPNTATAQVRVAIWAKVAVGSDAAPVFTSTETGTAGGMDCMLFELSGANTVTPVDKTATYASGASPLTLSGSTMTATTAALAGNAEFAIACFAQQAAAGSLTWTDTGTGLFSKLLNGNGASSVLQTYIGVVNPYPGGATLNDSGAFSVNTSAFGAALVVAFAQAPSVPAVNVAFANNAAGTVTAGGTTNAGGVSGTVEAWTVNVSGAFPVASTTAQPPTQFTVCDPALPPEKFLVTVAPGGTGSSQSWTVTRGAEGTVPVAHTAGFTIVDVTTAGWLTGVSKELSATAYVDCDYTGVTDASAAFNTALASLPQNVNGRAVGKIIFGPGNVKMAITPDNPGPCVYIEGAGEWATFINSYVPGGDCFRVFDPTAYSATDATINGGGISRMTIRGDNAGAGAVGLHIGDVTRYEVQAVVLNFQGAGSKGVWFDNELYYTEMLTGDLYVSGCTQCVVFDNPAAAASTSTGSFARTNLIIRVEQGLDGTGQDWGDGVVLQNGAIIVDGVLTIIGNYAKSAAATSSAVLRLIGTTPAGHTNPGPTKIAFSNLNIGVELNPHAGNAFSPMTIFSDGTGFIRSCYGSLDFGASSTLFTPSNIGAMLLTSNFVTNGDTALGPDFQIFDAEQFTALTGAYTLTNSTSTQKLFNATANGAVTVRAATSYFFECEFDITGLSASAHTLQFSFGGTATYTSCRYKADTNTGAAGTLVAWTTAVSNVATVFTITASVTTTTAQARIMGIVRVNAGGTLIPSVTQVTASAAAIVGVNSWFRLWPVGSNVITNAGDWT